MNGDGSIRVLIVDDQALIRGGIRLLLERDPAFRVVGEADDGAVVLSCCDELRPDVVIMDVRMPGTDGVVATRTLVEHGCDPDHLIKVLILTTFDDDEVVYETLRAGAHGFLVKHRAPSALGEAVRTLAAGDAWIDPSVAAAVIEALRSTPRLGSPQKAVGLLTPRESEVLVLIASGLSNTEICHRLVLSEATVKTHISRIFLKTGVRDRAQAVILAFQSGLVVAHPT